MDAHVAAYQKQLLAEAAYQQQLLDLYGSTGASEQEIWDQKLMAFDTMTAAKMANATTEQEYYDTLALREMERSEMILKNEKSLYAEQAKLGKSSLALEKQVTQEKLGTVTAGLDAINSITKGRYRALYLTTQAVQAGQAIMSGYAASAAALAPPPLGLGPVAGLSLSFWATARGYASAAAIMAQAFGSTSSGGSSSTESVSSTDTDTSSLSGTTSTDGLTTETESTGVNLTLVVNGETKNIDEISENLLTYLYDQNGSVNGLSVAVERSA